MALDLQPAVTPDDGAISLLNVIQKLNYKKEVKLKVNAKAISE